MIALIAIAAAGVLLIGGVPAYAFFSASASGAPVSIRSGGMTMSVSGPTVGSVALAPSTTDVVARSGSLGLVPGVQGQTLAYTVTNTSTVRAPGRLTVSVATTGTPTSQWTQSVGALSATITVGSATASALTVTSAGASGTAVATPVLQPGGSTTVVIAFTLARMNGAADLAHTLTSGASTSVLSWATLQPTFTLRQVPITVTS